VTIRGLARAEGARLGVVAPLGLDVLHAADGMLMGDIGNRGAKFVAGAGPVELHAHMSLLSGNIRRVTPRT
jgi:hypothetical protein